MKNHLIDMANYHKWAYQRLLKSLEQVNDNEYFMDRMMFFKSIHKTLNHLYAVDILWLSRFQKTPATIKKLDTELCTDRQQLQKRLLQQAGLWIDFIANINPGVDSLEYKQMNSTIVNRPYMSAIAHVFNHGTHHRGQITSIISQLGKSTPELDFIYYLAEKN